MTAVLASSLVFSAAVKLTRKEPFVQGYLRVGVQEAKLNLLAMILLAGAAGLILGLFWAPIGVAAAIGVVGYFIGAIAFHIRAADAKNLPNPLALAVLAVVALVLRLATL
ncbi:MAG: DoxX family protein [Acidimicrobiales bacterium]